MRPEPYGVNPNIDALMDELKRLRRKVDGLPHFRWAVVTGINPLQIRLEEDSVPLLGRISSMVSGLSVGDRVRAELQNNRVVVHGAGSSPNRWTYLNYVSPFSNYNGTSANRPRVGASNGVVTVLGVATASANAVVGSSPTVMFILPAGYRPVDGLQAVMQGSGQNRWALQVRSNGEVTADRYGPATSHNSSVWLPFYATFVQA